MWCVETINPASRNMIILKQHVKLRGYTTPKSNTTIYYQLEEFISYYLMIETGIVIYVTECLTKYKYISKDKIHINMPNVHKARQWHNTNMLGQLSGQLVQYDI